MAQDDQRARLALLERQLRALGPQLPVPDASGMASTVRRQIESGTTRVDVSDVRELASLQSRSDYPDSLR